MASSFTLNDLLLIYTRDFLPLKAPTTQAQQRHLYQRLRADLGDMPLPALTPLRLRQWRDSLRKNYQPGTVRCYLNALAAVLTVAVNELELLEVSPLRKVRRPPNPPGKVRFLSQDEQVRLLSACLRMRAPALYPCVVLALYTGCRKTEIRCLRWEEVDLEGRCLRLLATKNGSTRVVPLVGEALTVLRQQYATRRLNVPWVFPRSDGKGAVDIDGSWRRMMQKVQLPNFRFHDLRHTAASYLAMSGATLAEIAEVLGHRSLQVTKRYSHFLDSHTAGVVERMAAQFLTPPPVK